jgi:hypothetical protein
VNNLLRFLLKKRLTFVDWVSAVVAASAMHEHGFFAALIALVCGAALSSALEFYYFTRTIDDIRNLD